MDLSAPIAYNGLTIPGVTPGAGGSPSTGIMLEAVNISDMDVDQYLERRALQDGLNASDVYIGARRVAIDAAIFGSTLAHGWDQLQAFARAFSPRIAYNADTANLGFLAFTFQQPTISTGTWSAGYIPLQFYLRPLHPVRYQIDAQKTGGKSAKGLSFRASALLVARDPRKYVQTGTTLSMVSTISTATNRGDYPTFPIVSWTLTSVGSPTLTVAIAGMSTVIDMSGQSSGTWQLDYASRVLSKSGVSFQNLIVSSDGYPEIQPGTVTSYAATFKTGLSGVVATLSFTDAFA